MADTSVPTREGPTVLTATTPDDIVSDPGGAGVQHWVPRQGLVITNSDPQENQLAIRIGGVEIDILYVPPAPGDGSNATVFWPGTVVVENGETLEVEVLTAYVSGAITATCSYMRTD